MTSNLSILITFLCIIVLTIAAAGILKIFRQRGEKVGTPELQGPKKIDILIKGDIFELGKLAIILDDLVRYDVPVKTILDLNIILEEVFNIVIKNQKAGQSDNKVLISLILENRQITAIIKDRNEPFDPTVMPKIDLNAPIEEISFQGLGFHMVRHLVDGMSYQRLDDRNVLTVKKGYATS